MLAAGCATEPPASWYLNGKTEREFYAASRYCDDRAGQALDAAQMDTAGRGMAMGGGAAAAGALLAGLQFGSYASLYESCMRANGFTKAN